MTVLGTISVVIPAYKAAGTIERALASVAAQTLKPDQVVVVDDGSHDGTAEAARACLGRMGSIELNVLEQENQGAGAARNRAIRESHGEWLAFLDADDEWMPDKLSHSLEILKAGGLGLMAHNYWAVFPNGDHLVDCAARFSAFRDPFVGLYRKGFLATSTVVVRRIPIIEAGGFDESLAAVQDFDLWLKVLKRPNMVFQVTPAALTRYHVTPGSITSHTKRRLDCGMTVATRHAPSMADLRYRITAIHYEAMRAALARGSATDAIRYFLSGMMAFYKSKL